MYNIGTQYIDSRDNTAWTIADLGEYQNGTLYTVINRQGEYKRHYHYKLEAIAENISSIKMVHTASLIGAQGLEVIFKVNSQWFNKQKRKGKIQLVIRALDISFLQSYCISEVIDLDSPSYSLEKRASKGLKTVKLTYTTSYEAMNKLKQLGIIDSISHSSIKPYNPNITFNSTSNSSKSQAGSKSETLSIGGIDIPINSTKNSIPHSESPSLVCVDFKSKAIVKFNYWLSYIKPSLKRSNTMGTRSIVLVKQKSK